ncbi:two-component sensor histidine kinase [Leucobacter viscericola]|uniref:histidine kinase n=1 Tax=Leucobacter viscericola TaxID=2714935 RepID=A0A6G7XCE6_9MICO|nr:ATP-binding protein [Leucobacter viscericola]QIK62077.1 two-component sensor histidine kinase [Leucobacter viscericola]
MTSAQAAEGPTKTAPRKHSWSLRTRIVAALAFTVILLSGTIAAIGLTSLQASLIQQLDGGLRALSSRVMVTSGMTGPDTPGGPGGDLVQLIDGPGVASGAVLVHVDASGASGVLLEEDFSTKQLSAEQLTAITSGWSDTPTRNITPGDGLGDYRFHIEQRGGVAMIVGLPLASVEQTISSLGINMALVAIAGCLVFGFLAAWYVRHELRPLEKVADAAEGIAETPLERGEVHLQHAEEPGPNAAGEVTRLVSGFNSMIDQVTQAFRARHDSEEKVRRFVSDASHELRTPLASIRGYSELTRRMSLELPKDAEYALGRIESESVRMTDLVEDLLLLARIDEGQELTSQPVDLTTLVSDAVNDAAVAGPDHEWLFDPEQNGAGAVTVTGDPARLQQVLVNLLANARIHTPEGTTVSVSLSEDTNWATVCVHDDGPGIPAEQLPKLFERFARGDASRTRATGSTGLGLAIIDAIVGAHGGELRVTSEPGDTSFIVRLPKK